MKPSIYLIVPAYNEGRVIESNLERILGLGYEIVVIDDGSSDDTWKTLRALPVHALRHPINLGQGAALQTGMTYAIGKGADYIVHFDADGQHQVQDIPILLAPLLEEESDFALGSRFLRKEDSEQVPVRRRLILKAGRAINFILTGVRLTDAHNGFRAMTAEAAAQLHLNENRMAHASEILVQIRRSGLRYVERPTTIVYTEYSQEKGQSAWNGIRIVMDLVLRRIFR